MVNWSEFGNLPGSVTQNFEILCRSLVWMHYNRYGEFKAEANQPGIEFDLNLNGDCTLGLSGKWFGWQCRWWELPSGKAIGNTRKKKIEEALAQTYSNRPGITDWVLWTRHPLTKRDQDWFYGLKTNFKLHLWTVSEAETLLSGDAEILKQTYFGNLILTPERLLQLREESVAPIRARWLPDVHQVVDAERNLCRILGHADSWNEVWEFSKMLVQVSGGLESEMKSIPVPLSDLAGRFVDQLKKFSQCLSEVFGLLESGQVVSLQQVLRARTIKLDPLISSVPRKLRGARLACGLLATNALSYYKSGERLLEELEKSLEHSIVAVLADAGGGKTQLSAELSAARNNRPAGILVLGRYLHHGQSLDDLARRVVISGQPVQSMLALIAAVNAAGERAMCRLPIVIDGLNEAEDPRSWKPLLASLEKSLGRYQHVLIVCTLRTGSRSQSSDDRIWRHSEFHTMPSFAEQCLPEGLHRIEIPGFQSDTTDAIKKYFSFFKIKADLIDQPLQLLSHPLTLRIFCEVTNPSRSGDVGMEKVPRSLASMFERYIDQAAERIEELSPHLNRHYRRDVYNCLDVLGQDLWEDRSRELNEMKFRLKMMDERRDWNNSIVTLLEQEGVILRMPGETRGTESIIPVYDLLGGYLIANSIVSNLGRSGIISWLKDKSTVEAITGDYAVRHPLAEDIFRFLAALIPQRLSRLQLWQLVDEPLRAEALELSTLLEGRYLDSETINAISEAILKNDARSPGFFKHLVGVRASINHPLNALFLDSVLRKLSVAQRDLLWTEWLRRNENACLNDVETQIENWKASREGRSTADALKAKWLMWLLPTTIHRLRDTTTLALYWFGRGDVVMLFELTEGAADINDPYVIERLMSACYGVSMALSADCKAPSFRTKILARFAIRFYNLFFQEDAISRTTHVLIREYGRRLLELAEFHNPGLFSTDQLSRIKPPYSNGGRIDWQKVRVRKKDISGGESPFRMDFENYTIGHLAKGRRNYDFDHKGYQKIRAQILWRIVNLGWVGSKFKDVDWDIERKRAGYSRHDNDVSKIDRYGKKYSWVAYFEMDGWLQDRGERDKYTDDDYRTWDIDIDPSFPSVVPENELITLNLLGDSTVDFGKWVNTGEVPELHRYFVQKDLLGHLGQWIMLDGHISQEDEKIGRNIFAFVRTLLVRKEEAQEIVDFLVNQKMGERRLPEKPEFHYTFSGEIPWSETFPDRENASLEFQYRSQVKRVKKVQETFYLNGKPIELSHLDLLRLSGIELPSKGAEKVSRLSDEELAQVKIEVKTVEVDEIAYDLKKFNVEIPICDMRTPGKTLSTTSTSGSTLSKRIAEKLKLSNIPQSYDLQNQDGERVTIQAGSKINSYTNSQGFFFIRQEELKQLLQKLEMSLLFVVWGERMLSTGESKRRRNNREDEQGQQYGEFQAVYPFPFKL